MLGLGLRNVCAGVRAETRPRPLLPSEARSLTADGWGSRERLPLNLDQPLCRALGAILIKTKVAHFSCCFQKTVAVADGVGHPSAFVTTGEKRICKSVERWRAHMSGEARRRTGRHGHARSLHTVGNMGEPRAWWVTGPICTSIRDTPRTPTLAMGRSVSRAAHALPFCMIVDAPACAVHRGTCVERWIWRGDIAQTRWLGA